MRFSHLFSLHLVRSEAALRVSLLLNSVMKLSSSLSCNLSHSSTSALIEAERKSGVRDPSCDCLYICCWPALCCVFVQECLFELGVGKTMYERVPHRGRRCVSRASSLVYLYCQLAPRGPRLQGKGGRRRCDPGGGEF